MVLKPSRSSRRWNRSGRSATAGQKVVLLSAQGRLFDQALANRLKRDSSELLLICGRYEGVDERVAEHLADEEISIGNYVLSGGELAAAVVVDTVARLLPGVLGNEASSAFESFQERGTAKGCWIARTRRGRRNFAAGRRRRCCSAAITKRSASSGGRSRWRRRRGCGRICSRSSLRADSPAPDSLLYNSRCWTEDSQLVLDTLTQTGV